MFSYIYSKQSVPGILEDDGAAVLDCTPMRAGKISATAWNAVLKRDRAYDGKFVYVATTTGIYCRPSCPSRRPHRRHALMFSNPEEAEHAGYVACRRCHPKSLTPAEESIRAALDHIEAHIDRKVTLEELSQVSGLSPNHLQQTFKRIVGVSPRAFYNAQRLIRFKQMVREGESISSTCYASGYGSIRALYEVAMQWLGMTPRTYQRNGEGTTIRYSIMKTSLGRLLLAGTERGVSSVRLGQDDDVLLREFRGEFPGAVLLRDEKRLTKWIQVVRSCNAEDAFLTRLPPDRQRRLLETKVLALIAISNLRI
jgi:AraC family transcriptional regulator of adaptative response/methylated-DNA-[protein]-cysteine methyltransferase